MSNRITVKGAEHLMRALNRLTTKVARKHNRAATRSAVGAMAKIIKPEVPKDEGVTRAATTYKVFGKGLNVGGVVGADIAKMQAGEERPYNVDWLVEMGHVAPDGTFVPPSGYMRRTAPSALARGERVYADRLAYLIDSEI